MDYIFFTGLLGSLVLVSGAAWPDSSAKTVNSERSASKQQSNTRLTSGPRYNSKLGSSFSPSHPAKSTKNWLFAIGGLIMLLYSIFGYLQGGPVFFVFLETLVVIASALMMCGFDDRIDTAVISTCGLGFIIWSLYIFEGYNTVFFIFGLSGIGLGYAFENGTLRRDIALTSGSALIAFFSYIENSWVFFWLNVFFAIFSAWYLWKNLKSSLCPPPRHNSARQNQI